MPLPSWLPAALAEAWEQGGFGLYVHWPYCVSKCPYCDFNSHVAGKIDPDAWARAYVAAIDRAAGETPGRRLRSIYFGGGTPSLMPPALVGAVIEQAQRRWRFANAIEITLEANPGSVEAARFAGYRSAGVNRVSLGIQALDDTDLRRLGRSHDVAQAMGALDISRATFDRVSFDLIYARQHQTPAAWQDELGRALALGPDHLSLYQLTIEPDTVFGARARLGKLPGLPGEDPAADMYEITQSLCEAAGLPAYEVSNHAKTGSESVHNMIYWQAGDYVGIGPGAHGRITVGGIRHATRMQADPGAWLSQTLAGGTGEASREALSGPDQALEYLLMGLRTRQGIDLTLFEQLGGRPLPPARLHDLMDLGLLAQSGTRLFATRQGMPVLNAILTELARDL